MSRQRGSGRVAGHGVVIPGLYQDLLETERDKCSRPDPRIYVSPTDEVSTVIAATRSRLLDMLEDAVPVSIPRWRVGGNSFPEAKAIPWIAARSCRNILVWPDDTVEPTDDDGDGT